MFLNYFLRWKSFAVYLSLINNLDKGTVSPHKHTELYIISLVNKHKTKDLTKMLAHHMQTYVKRIIDYNQLKFIIIITTTL